MTGLTLQLDGTQLFLNVSIATPNTTTTTTDDDNKKPPELKIVSLLHCILVIRLISVSILKLPSLLLFPFLFKGPYHREEKQTGTKLQFSTHFKVFSYNSAPGHDYYILASLENC